MKTPQQLSQKLQRQWQNGEIRERRLLDPGQWPLRLPIGKPSPKQITDELARVREHIRAWREVGIGEVEWGAVNYRSVAEAVELPLHWVLRSTEEWAEAAHDRSVRQEFALIARILAATDPGFHPLIVRQRQLILTRGGEETIQACRVAQAVEPGCAQGRPLRALSIAGCDSKFLERNRTLISKLMEVRFGPEALEPGLEAFLGALDEGEHWLLVAALDEGLLPFEQLRVRSSELARTPLPAGHILIVENERALYQLPRCSDTIAILGAGLNLGWMGAGWLAEKRLGYWGDMDSWGLAMLAEARRRQPHAEALLMGREVFAALAGDLAVAEPVVHGDTPPDGLDEAERALYQHLINIPRGRLEQEFLPSERVVRAVREWRGEGRVA